MSIGEVEIRGHMDGFDQGGQAAAHLRFGDSCVNMSNGSPYWRDAKLLRIEDCVILPNVEIGNNVTLRRVIVDNRCRLADGLKAGIDPAADRKRFHVTDRGVTVIVPESLGQRVHHLR